MEILEQLSSMDKSEAIAVLKDSYTVFCSAIQSCLDRTQRHAIVPEDDSPEELYICERAAELRQYGYTKLRPLIGDGEILAVPREFAKVLPGRAAVLGVGGEYLFDPQLQGLFWGRHVSQFNTRISYDVEKAPVFLRPLLEGAALSDKVINKSIGVTGVRIKQQYLIVDNLQPTDTVDFLWWHFDRLMEQYKVQICLEEVHAGNGPMRLLPGTHEFKGDRRIYDFCQYAEPHHGADPGYNVIKNRLADIVSAEGKPGDAFIFDTKAFHAHGRPTATERNTATIYYQAPPTPLNLFYQHYRPEGQTNGY